MVGIRDEALSEKLQLDPGLTLEKAKKLVRQREAVHEQQQVLKEEPSGTMEEMRVNPGRKPRNWQQSRQQQNRQQRPWQHPHWQQQQQQCSRCGRGPHPLGRCPARDAQCHRCQMKGHFSVQCRSKVAAEVCDESREDSAMDCAFLGTVATSQESTWKAKLQLAGRETEFKLQGQK